MRREVVKRRRLGSGLHDRNITVLVSEARRQSTPCHATPCLRYIKPYPGLCMDLAVLWLPAYPSAHSNLRLSGPISPVVVSCSCLCFIVSPTTTLGWHVGCSTRRRCPRASADCSGVHIHHSISLQRWGGVWPPHELGRQEVGGGAGGLSNLHLCSHSPYDVTFKRENTAQLEILNSPSAPANVQFATHTLSRLPVHTMSRVCEAVLPHAQFHPLKYFLPATARRTGVHRVRSCTL